MKRNEGWGQGRARRACAIAIAAALGATLLGPAPGARGDDDNGRDEGAAEGRPSIDVPSSDPRPVEQQFREAAAQEGVVVRIAPGTVIFLTEPALVGDNTDIVSDGQMVDRDGDRVPYPVDVNGSGWFIAGTGATIDGTLIPTNPVRRTGIPVVDCEGRIYGGPWTGGFPLSALNCLGRSRFAGIAVRNYGALIANYPTAETDITVEGCDIGFARNSGVRLWHLGCETRSHRSRLTIKGSVLHDCGVSGAQIVNSATEGTRSNVQLRQNRLLRCKFAGMELSAGDPATACTIDVLSIRNIYEHNRLAVSIFSKDFPPFLGVPFGSNECAVDFRGVDDAMWANSFGASPAGAIVAFGGIRSSVSADPSNDNATSIELIGTRFFKEGLPTAEQNQFLVPGGGLVRRDITLVGASGSGLVENSVTYVIRRIQTEGLPNLLAVSTEANPVIQRGSDVAFDAENPGIGDDDPPTGDEDP